MTKVEHLLVCLMEECSEVQKEASKALRFGVDSKDVFKYEKETHGEKIVTEFADILAIIYLLQEEGVVPDVNMRAMIAKKKEKTMRYINRELEKGE